MIIDPLNNLAVLIPTIILLSIGDSIFSTHINGILLHIFPGHSEASFATFMVYQGISTAIMLFGIKKKKKSKIKQNL